MIINLCEHGFKGILSFFSLLFFLTSLFFIQKDNVFVVNSNWFSPAMLLLMAITMFTLLHFIYVHLEEKAKLIDATIFSLIILAQIITAKFLSIGLTTDNLRVKSQAFSLANNNYNWSNYFYFFPNNVNASIIYSWIIRFFKIISYKHADQLTTLLLFFLADAAIFIGYKIVKMLSNHRNAGTVFLLLTACFLPFYFYPLNFYTDSLMFFFPILSFYSFLKSIRPSSQVNQLIFFSVATVSLGIGCLIKTNVAIIFFAFILTSILTCLNSQKRVNRWQYLSIRLGIITIVLVSIFFLNSSMKRANGFENNLQREIPSTAWIYMSLNPNSDGQTNTDLYQFGNIKSMTERKIQVRHGIKERIMDLGPSGLINHFWRKFLFMFSTGVMNSDDGGLQALPHNKISEHLSQIVFLLANVTQVAYILILFGFSSFSIHLKCKHVLCDKTMFATLSILGIMTFHVLFWESEGRYAFIILMFLIILGAIGLSDIFEEQKKHALKGIENNKKIKVLIIGVIALVAISTSQPLTRVQINEEIPVAQQVGFPYALKTPLFVKAGRTTRQEFYSHNTFSKISLDSNILQSKKIKVYIFDDLDKKNIYVKSPKSDGVKTIIPIAGHAGRYEIKIKNVSKDKIAIWDVNYSPDYSLAPDGLQSKNQRGYYLPFKAFYEKKEILLSKQLLWLIMLFCLVIILMNIYFSQRKSINNRPIE